MSEYKDWHGIPTIYPLALAVFCIAKYMYLLVDYAVVCPSDKPAAARQQQTSLADCPHIVQLNKNLVRPGTNNWGGSTVLVAYQSSYKEWYH